MTSGPWLTTDDTRDEMSEVSTKPQPSSQIEMPESPKDSNPALHVPRMSGAGRDLSGDKLAAPRNSTVGGSSAHRCSTRIDARTSFHVNSVKHGKSVQP